MLVEPLIGKQERSSEGRTGSRCRTSCRYARGSTPLYLHRGQHQPPRPSGWRNRSSPARRGDPCLEVPHRNPRNRDGRLHSERGRTSVSSGNNEKAQGQDGSCHRAVPWVEERNPVRRDGSIRGRSDLDSEWRGFLRSNDPSNLLEVIHLVVHLAHG